MTVYRQDQEGSFVPATADEIASGIVKLFKEGEPGQPMIPLTPEEIAEASIPQDGSKVIEPGTGVLATAEVQVRQPPSEDSRPLEFYTFDNGEYVPVMDILYPAGTKFYAKNPDGTFVPTGVQPDTLSDELPKEITEEFIISRSTEFLRARGYTVLAADESAEYRNQISQLKDQVNALSKPVKPGDRAFEGSVLLAKLRSMINSHMPSHALVDEALKIVKEIEELF